MRLSSARIITGFVCLLFAVAAWRLIPSNAAVEAQTAKPAVASQSSLQLQPANASIPASKTTTIPDPKPVAAPGTEIYTAKRGEAIPTIARRYLGQIGRASCRERV